MLEVPRRIGNNAPVTERSLPSRIWRGLLVLVAFLVLLYHVVGGWFLSGEIVDTVFSPPVTLEQPDPDPPTPAEAGVDVDEVTYESPLGPMDAWVTDGSRSEWIIHVHGAGASRSQALDVMAFLDEAGYHQMAIAHRTDEGQPSGPEGLYRYGAAEHEDLAAAVELARAEGADQIVLYGYGSGAAVANAYAIRQPIGTVTGMVFDSPNLDLDQTVSVWAERQGVFGFPPPVTVVETAKFFASLRTDINWENYDYLDRADALSVPVLVLHGAEDDVVPLEISVSLTEMRPDLVRLVVTQGAGNLGSYETDPGSYEQAVLDFLAG